MDLLLQQSQGVTNQNSNNQQQRFFNSTLGIIYSLVYLLFSKKEKELAEKLTRVIVFSDQFVTPEVCDDLNEIIDLATIDNICFREEFENNKIKIYLPRDTKMRRIQV